MILETSDYVAKKVGLAKAAYTGAPHGIAQVDLSNPEEPTARPHWSYKTKRLRRQEVIDTL
ncbi:MAG TPA: hypothetical protein VFQ43_14540 [Nitrososphaera sp.]|nr:hypothetical protein [Nitrososphaera sp.]